MTELTEQEVDGFISSPTLTVLDFWAPWCGPCKAMAPTLDALVAEGKFNLGKVNVDSESSLCTKFDIKSVPTLLFFKNGELLCSLVGLKSRAAILLEIEKISMD